MTTLSAVTSKIRDLFKQRRHWEPLLAKSEIVERVKNFKYLSFLKNNQWNTFNKIICRMEIARDAFFKYKKTPTNHEIRFGTKIRFIKCYIWSILLSAVDHGLSKVQTRKSSGI